MYEGGSVKVAVVGATGAVGETLLRVLEEREVPVSELGAFASRFRPDAAAFRGRRCDVHETSEAALRGYDAIFFAGSDEASERYVPALLERGAIVIDNSATYRMEPGVPLIVPEVNPQAVLPTHRLFPVGNCTAIILCVALAPVRTAAGLVRAQVATYQAVSGAGRAGLDELAAGERALADGRPEPHPQAFAAAIARNVIPQIGSFDAAGWSGEENKVRAETRKILDLPDLAIAVTSVRVPVRTAHSEAVFFETERATSVAELAAAFERAPGVAYHAEAIVTPREVEGTDAVHVARLRGGAALEADPRESQRHFQMWIVGDQLRKGAATNAVQILELAIARGAVTSA